MHVALLSQDLYFGSKVRAAAEAATCELSTCLNSDRLRAVANSTHLQLVILDLASPGVRQDVATLVGWLRELSAPPRVIAFGPHVQTEALRQAAEQCDQVFTRGQFASQLDTLFHGAEEGVD